MPHDLSITYNDSKPLGAGISEFEPLPTSRLCINLVPHSAWEFNELVGIPIHLKETSAKVIALLAGIIDVVNPWESRVSHSFVQWIKHIYIYELKK